VILFLSDTDGAPVLGRTIDAADLLPAPLLWILGRLKERRAHLAPWLLFFFHRHRDVGVRREPDLVAFDAGNQAFADEMMMPLMRSLAAVLLRQLDAAAFDFVDGI